MKKNKGITLISLVVTIIVLIILAGISINLVLGDNGIITKAKEGKQNYEISANEEYQQLANAEIMIDSIVAENSKTILKAGDYIKYDTGDTSIGDNGVITCRVLHEANSAYGLQIISNTSVTDITLGSTTYSEAVESYNNAIETLNNKAEEYLNTTYATDARCVGSLPSVDENGIFIEKDNGATTYITLTFTNSSYINSLDEDTNYEADVAAIESANILYSVSYEDYYTNSDIYEYVNNLNIPFWLASRYVSYGGNYVGYHINSHSNVNFYSDETDMCFVRSSDGNVSSESWTRGFRPCFALRSDIKIVDGDGKSEETAYQLGI